MVGDALRKASLVEILASYSAAGPSIHAVTTAVRATSANTRAFVRFLVEAFAR